MTLLRALQALPMRSTKFSGNSLVLSLSNQPTIASLWESSLNLKPWVLYLLFQKGDKPKQFLDNWRPITLQNSIYKLISGVIAKRINGVLPDIIHSDQSGFVNGRYIGDCIRNTYDILQWAKTKKKTGLLLLIDFAKAFESISFKYIIKTLSFFAFGRNMSRHGLRFC